jgi:hypothetical protein
MARSSPPSSKRETFDAVVPLSTPKMYSTYLPPLSKLVSKLMASYT